MFKNGDGEYRPRIPQYPQIQDLLGTAVNAVLVGHADPKKALDASSGRGGETVLERQDVLPIGHLLKLRRSRQRRPDLRSGRLSVAAAACSPTAAGGRSFLVLLGAPALIYVLLVAILAPRSRRGFSFYDYSLLRPARTAFVGLANYGALWANEAARKAFATTALFTASAVAVEFLFGFGLALLLWRDSAFQRACLALLLIPVTVTPIVVGLVFRALLAPDYGLVGYYLAAWGVSARTGSSATRRQRWRPWSWSTRGNGRRLWR